MKSLYNGKVIIESGVLIKGSGCLAATSKAPRNPQKQNLQNNPFLDTTISKILCDFPFR